MRIFIAINLPGEEKQRLSAILDHVAAFAHDVRWVAAESLHITMKFLGDVAEARIDGIKTVVHAAAANVAPFRIEIGGFGAFPSASRPSVFWLGIGPSPELAQLQDRIESGCTALGFEREARPFKPHLTLGRTRKDARVPRAVMDRMTAQVGYKADVVVESVDLMRSHLGTRGARYELLERALLE